MTLELAARMAIPAGTKALLFDMDGVLLDTLQLDYDIVEVLAKQIVDAKLSVSQETIRENFAYDMPQFWRRVLASSGATDVSDSRISSLVERHIDLRSRWTPIVHAGILQILDAAREQRLFVAVVSNNPKHEVEELLAGVGILERVDAVVGNDHPGLARKPEPDCYLEAARIGFVPPSQCVVIEDSLLGAKAGASAGCFVIGVATGGTSYDELSKSEYVSACYESFAVSNDSMGR